MGDSHLTLSSRPLPLPGGGLIPAAATVVSGAAPGGTAATTRSFQTGAAGVASGQPAAMPPALRLLAPSRASGSRLGGPEDMSTESRVFFSPWSRLARGTGLGPHTIDYDPATAENLRESFAALDRTIPGTQTYNHFSRLLTELILDVENPARPVGRSELERRTASILDALQQETNPYQFATAASILMDTFAKLGLDPALLVNDRLDLVEESLRRVETIPFKDDGIYGYYERVTAYTGLFVSIGQLGMKDRLVTADRNYVRLALSQLETIPSPWNRGRGASMLFAAMKVLGFEDYLFGDGRDYLKETLDYVDRAEELNIWPSFPAKELTHAYFTIEPYITLLNAISILGRPEYLTYKTDRIARVNAMMEALTPEEKTLIGEYYLLTLYNLGALEQVIPDRDRYMRDFMGLLDGIEPAPAWFPNGVSYPYAMEAAWFFGRTDLITDDMIQKMIDSMPRFVDQKDLTNWGHPVSYILNILGQLGMLDRIFQPSSSYEGKAPLVWAIEHFAGNPQSLPKSLPLFDHAAISLALRMRGAGKDNTPMYDAVVFERDRASRRAVVKQIREKKLLAGMHSHDIKGNDVDAIVEMARTYEAKGIIPEIGTSPGGLEAIRRYRAAHPTAIIAAGEIEENNIPRALAAVAAGANILVALENPLSRELVAAVRKADPAVVIIAAASNEDEAERSIDAGVDGIKIRPFSMEPGSVERNLELLRTLRLRHKDILLGGSRGIRPDQLRHLIGEGLEFAGLGVKTALAGAEELASVDVSEERIFFGPGSRLVRGIGMGHFPIDYDPQTAATIRRASETLNGAVPPSHAYRRFSGRLVELILDLENPEATSLSPYELRERIDGILEALKGETNPYDFVSAASILAEVFAKLGLDVGLVMNERFDLIEEALSRAETIPFKDDGLSGHYERTMAYAKIFLAAGHLGYKDRLTSGGRDYIQEALNLLEQIPSAWSRVRAASTVFTALKIVGREDALTSRGGDLVKESLDFLDAATEEIPGVSQEFARAFPLLTLLNSIALFGRSEDLQYKRDRLEQARDLMSRLPQSEKIILSQYYLITLRNLGKLDRVIPDVDTYLQDLVDAAATIDTTGRWFPNGVVFPYLLGVATFFGRADLISDEMIRGAIATLPANFSDPEFAVNRDNPLAYTLNALGERGLMDRLFTPSDDFAGEVPFDALVGQMAASPQMIGRGLFSLEHSLISLALRMRGA